jgi:hypothetical protein
MKSGAWRDCAFKKQGKNTVNQSKTTILAIKINLKLQK